MTKHPAMDGIYGAAPVANISAARETKRIKRLKMLANGPAWLERAQEENGNVLGNIANVALALRSDDAWRGILAYDEMRCSVVLNRPVPIVGVDAAFPYDKPRPLKDADVEAAQEWMQLIGIRKLGSATVHDGLDLVAREITIHPLRDWLSSLTWDGEKRADSWLTTYLGVEPDDYSRTIGRMFLIAMVARVMQPGCKTDYMLILEGEQGAMKSTACRILAGDEYFSDSMPADVTHKDAALHLRGKWLIEMAEMHPLSRNETTALKAFLTRTVDIYRPPYGRLEVHEPRQCLFAGTTNSDSYLKDETGGRRFWPVKVGTILPAALERDRPKLFAEALAAYRDGEHWWPDAVFEREHIAPQQAARYMADEWQEPIANYLAHETKVTVSQVAREALNIQAERLDRALQNRIAAVMRTIGWRQGARTGKARWWVSDAEVTQ
jgi:predicted P-loop ATPase